MVSQSQLKHLEITGRTGTGSSSTSAGRESRPTTRSSRRSTVASGVSAYRNIGSEPVNDNGTLYGIN